VEVVEELPEEVLEVLPPPVFIPALPPPNVLSVS